MKFLILLSFSFSLMANEQVLILEEIQKSIIDDYKLSPSNQTITVIEKEPTQGQKRVQQQLEENRKKIQKNNGKSLTGKEKIAEMLKKNRERIKALKAKEQIGTQNTGKGDLISQKLQSQHRWEKNRQHEIANWEKEKKQILAKWYAARKKYLKRVPEYKKTVTAIPAPKISTQKIKKITKTIPPLSEYHLVKGAFAGQAKDQGKRPTCAAFAGIRAIEIMLAQQENYQPLSEQYFFWASLPQCQRSPCPQQGSWVKYEYQKSARLSRPDIPTASSCPYSSNPNPGNVNQTPLRYDCNQGYAKVERFSEVISAAQILEKLKQNKPVVGAFKLSKNFYYNTGYVFLNKKLKFDVKIDSHAAGHAILLIGYMKLPDELKKSEGSYCFIAANSWGIGWGKGGHACLSEKWFEKHRYEIPFIALEKVRI